MTEAERQFKAERGGGNYGAGTKEMQVWAAVGLARHICGSVHWNAACMLDWVFLAKTLHAPVNLPCHPFAAYWTPAAVAFAIKLSPLLYGCPALQERNYIARKEAERLRRELFDDALAKFRKGKVEEVGTIQQR